ncbi:MAG: DUF6174 domain-containing protein [Chloroflexota bacterium]
MKKQNRILIALVLVLFLSACSGGALQSNREKWDSQAASHYRFNLSIGCFCPYHEIMPLTVEVQDGQIVSMTDVNGQPVREEFRANFEEAATIEGLFAIVEQAASGGADEIKVEYDAAYGFPSSISIDYIKEAMDDEISYHVLNFEVLP